MKLGRRLILLAAIFLLCSAHVGSPDAWYRGIAGPYDVLVHVQAPTVIPGVAVVNVYVEGGGVERVDATADHVAATGGAPPPEVAALVDPAASHYRTRLWIMTTGSFSITVGVSGSRGSGKVVVPLGAVPLRRHPFAPYLQFILAAAGIILVAGLINIVGAGVREGTLPEGEQPTPDRRRRARLAMIRAGALTTVTLAGGAIWWAAEDAAFERSMFKPLTAAASITGESLVLTITDSAWRARRQETRRTIRENRPALITDHGKIMHLFLVDEKQGAVFAHLHPETADTLSFTTTLPPLPAGRYTVFADIVMSSGFTQTLVATVAPPSPVAGTLFGGGDDSYLVHAAGGAANTFALADSARVTLVDPQRQRVAGEEARLRFVVESPPGAAPLEDYMGMRAHAAVVRDDGRIFVHLHPMGTISMAAQARVARDSNALHTMTHDNGQPEHGDSISFPYAFPEPGRYHIWVQTKRAGVVRTALFTIVVAAAGEKGEPAARGAASAGGRREFQQQVAGLRPGSVP